MNLKCLVVFFSLFSITAHAQHLQGNVIDGQTNQTIPGATISIASKNFFYPADNDGKFDISDSRIQSTDTISISCVGYITQKMVVRDFGQETVVKLQPFTTQLKEVKVGYTKSQIINVGSKVKSYFGTASILPGMEIAMFMPGSAGVKGIIQTAEFYLREGNLFTGAKGDVTAPFRVRLYSVGADGKPGKELISDVIIVSAKKKNDWFVVDISRYQVENPGSGFFVSFGLLDARYYQVNSKYRGIFSSSADIKTPRLSFTEKEFKEVLSYHGSSNGSWHPTSANYLIRATIAADAY
ncbi:carboxypeptidase-like regulatory domain-containing protein [Mucilaginibacter mali]|uniref:Carboxypeptidase-like regulatory domain-containing protein n=1 Tax=Mucilaginibacter mali TaxID=2740462 RepID=A0A7D4UCD8_9SPHI|nr:carboxypeptidase-like regulatory domain-containing protein [Mucilaginibacter mali]QKJ31658.1 carboxypeptidase-like regulatory domain-containing protein [Mucilaginibacter mali]